MQSSLRWKVGLLFFIILFSAMTVIPSFKADVPGWWKTYVAPDGLRLGLDLQGGMHLVMKVDLESAIEKNLDIEVQDLKEALAEKRITVVRTPGSDRFKVILTLPNTGALNTVEQVMKDDFPDLAPTIQAEAGSFPRITLTLSQEKIDFINKNAVNQSLEIIRNRIDQFGVAEPVIVRQGSDEIIIQLPGVKDAKRALALIGQTAQLEFKMVDEDSVLNLPQMIDQAIQAGQWMKGGDRRELNMSLANRLPAGSEIYFEKEVDKNTGKEIKTPLLIKSQTLMTGDMVKDAQVRVGGTYNEPYVSLDLTGRGGKIFAQVTEKNVGKRFAIILDENVRSAPVIREKILGGSASISGSFDYQEATDLAIVLRVGALPAPVEIVQNLTVGASLGQDSINKGLMSGLFGAALVLVFMIIYYRLSGIIANFALMMNVLMLFAGMAMMGGTLTLPGIAGIILSIGMAVDSNVLIFERMREEFALGKSVKSGVEGGYEKAFWTIVDSQVTTLITALALFMFGTGPIKGFAVTLSLGVTFNLITTLFGTRTVYDALHSGKLLKPLKFLQFTKKPNLNYMGVRNITFIISAVLVLLGMFSFVQVWRGEANLGVDFSGGTIVQYKAAQPFTLEEVRRALDKSDIDGAQPQQVENENRLIIKVKKSEKVVGHISEAVTQLLTDKFPDRQFELESQSEIGSSISEVLRNKAFQAIAISLMGVIFYLALRFDFRFGLAAAAATFHDVMVVLGLCYVMNIEITLLIVTSLLTLAGYSLNDSVVVFDRIREHMHKTPEASMSGMINSSINEVLGRTIVTSLTTGLVLLALFILGGTVIHDFSLTLLMGLAVGTYSSIFVASPLLYQWRRPDEAA